MKKQFNLYWGNFLTLTILTIMTALISSFVYVSAEDHPSATKRTDDFKVGDKVEVSISGLVGDRYYEPCVILEVRNNGYMVRCVAGNGEYFVLSSWVRAVKKTQSAKKTEPIKENEPQPKTDEDVSTNEQIFKALDGNESGWLSGKELIACQCKEFDKNADNEVTKAEFLAGMNKKEIAATDDDDEKQTEENKPTANEDCTSNAALVIKNTTAKPSEELFKGLIFYNYNLSANGTGQGPLKVGVTFLSFQMGTSFTNIARNGFRINDAAPVNTKIYRAQSKHIVCEQSRDATQRRQVESNYACFKNKDGIWVCGIDGFPKITQLK